MRPVGLVASFALTLAAFVAAGCSSGGGAGGGCPASVPASGAACGLLGTSSCSYASGDSCGGDTVATCTSGHWVIQEPEAPGLYAGCPATIPVNGASCGGGCGGAAQSCSYGCDQGGPATASCVGGAWSVQTSGVACFLDGGAEAGEGGQPGCRSAAQCGGNAYCQAPMGPYLTGYSLGSSCSADAQCGADAAVSPLCGKGGCVCQSTEFSPRPYAGGQQGAGFCLSPCKTASDCGTTLGVLYGDATGFTCGAGGHCVPRTCAAPADCPAFFDCAAQQCVRRSCGSDPDCGGSGACVDGACYPAAGSCQSLPA